MRENDRYGNDRSRFYCIPCTILPLTYFIDLPMKMEPIVSSETSAIRTQTPGNYPKRNKLQDDKIMKYTAFCGGVGGHYAERLKNAVISSLPKYIKWISGQTFLCSLFAGLKKVHPVHAVTTFLFKWYFNAIFPSMPRTSKQSLCFRFPNQDPVYISPFPIQVSCSGYLIILDFITQTAEMYK